MKQLLGFHDSPLGAGAELLEEANSLDELERIREQNLYGSFPPRLEHAYRRDRRRRHAPVRAALFMAQAIVVGLGPFYSGWFYAPDASIKLWLDLGHVFVALLLICAAVLTTRKLRGQQLGRTYQPVALVGIAACALLLQYLSLRGFLAWPPEMVGVMVMSSAVLAGYRWGLVCAGIFIVLLISSGLELAFVGATQPALLHLFTLFLLALMSMLGIYAYERLSRQAWIAYEFARVLARTDPLTGLSTRMDFSRMFESRLAQARRDRRHVAVLMLDIDHFKVINDRHGHVFGDQVLHTLGRLILDRFAQRPLDLRVRYGGEEIAMLWYDIEPTRLGVVTDRLLDAIRALRFPSPGGGADVHITASLGATWLQPTEPLRPEALLDRADELLYEAKRGGRDRSKIAPYYVEPELETVVTRTGS